MTRPDMWDDSPEACAYRMSELVKVRDLPPCAVADCDREGPRVRGMCVLHYQRWWRSGTFARYTFKWSEEPIEDIGWLLSQGVAPVEIAQRIGIKPASIWRGLNRRGRDDLAAPFRPYLNEHKREARAKRRGLSASPERN